ncbi:class III poly(R)-hydroxyalkanoic acid synthase subunit PhaE [Pseudoxanthomonas wuyuanensis]
MANFAPPWSGDFESMARQYWNLWGDALRQGAGGAAPQTPDWRQAVDWWSQLVPGGNHQVDDVVERFNQQARHWYGQMQQVAAQFAGRDHNASDIRQAWQQALGMPGDQHPQHNPFAELFRAMQGSGQSGMDGWLEQARPYIDALQREGSRWLHAPTFGLHREQQERWQHLALAQQECQRQQGEYNALMLKAAQRAFGLFEQKLETRAEPGRQITTARGLFDLWIDAAEAAYAEVALSAEFRTVYGALANAQMRLRQSVQREVEQVCGLFGMPTRTEVDSAHRKIVELERKLRRAAAPAAEARTGRRPPGTTRAVPATAVEAPPQAPESAQAPATDAATASATANSRQKRKRAKPVKTSATAKGRRQVAKPADKAVGKAPKKPLKTAAKKAARNVSAKTAPAKTAPVKAAAKKTAKPARKPAAKAPARKARAVAVPPPPSAAVVSIKDWVTRNAAAAPPPKPHKSGSQKRKRGSRK